VKILFPRDTKKYMELQCNSNLKKYTDCPEVQPVRKILKNLNPKNILEIGAGIGRASVYLFNEFKWNDAHFYLLDGDSGDHQICYVNKEVGNNFYNSIDAARNFCFANGMGSDHLHFLNAENNKWRHNGVRYDLCYSFKAIGFHWPVTEHLHMIYPLMTKGACLIFEIRPATPWYGRTQHAEFDRNQIKSIPYKLYNVCEINITPASAVLVLERR